MYQTLSDLLTCYEMLLAVCLHRPQNAARTVEEVRATEDRESWKLCRPESYTENLTLLQHIGTSLNRDFFSVKPPIGPKNADWLVRSRALRTPLEKFWTSMRGVVRDELHGSAFNPAEVESLLQVTSANLSAEYLQQEQQAEAEILAAIRRLMFPDKDDVVKDVLWDRFAHTMKDAGFAARNCSGSAVAFKQLSGKGGRIVFHKPHPIDKIDPVLLRIMGERMTRKFGWRRETFVLCDDTN
ncbi:hypothetical protein FDENT_9342 [Fusarium denticulatum]|uniref:Uncharacterized protein n=1 Tax=Fusarium denticulatum TaxID=48507 RepID=A0A8H5TTI1_9HYPO|nr:hypothetical protein FDENT_9342 [Fusarium denticulatum]